MQTTSYSNRPFCIPKEGGNDQLLSALETWWAMKCPLAQLMLECHLLDMDGKEPNWHCGGLKRHWTRCRIADTGIYQNDKYEHTWKFVEDDYVEPY